MAQRLKKYNIDTLCTDEYAVYSEYKISNRHIQDKAETCLVESKNSTMRDCLAKLTRKTKRFPKSLEMLEFSLYILWFYKAFGRLVNCF
jgi:IS1 family transposase